MTDLKGIFNNAASGLYQASSQALSASAGAAKWAGRSVINLSSTAINFAKTTGTSLYSGAQKVGAFALTTLQKAVELGTILLSKCAGGFASAKAFALANPVASLAAIGVAASLGIAAAARHASYFN